MVMALLLDGVGRDYAHARMAATKTGKGPWGEAIKYWLPRRDMRQSDLARVTGIEEKTISSMARGFHTTTRKLEAVALAFKVPIDQVLVSPNRQQANEDRKREIQEAVEMALRRMDERQPPSSDSTLEAAEDELIQQINAKTRRANIAAAKSADKRSVPPKSKKLHRAK